MQSGPPERPRAPPRAAAGRTRVAVAMCARPAKPPHAAEAARLSDVLRPLAVCDAVQGAAGLNFGAMCKYETTPSAAEKIRLELKQAKMQGACSRRAWSSDNAAARPRQAASPHARRRIGLRMVGGRTARE